MSCSVSNIMLDTEHFHTYKTWFRISFFYVPYPTSMSGATYGEISVYIYIYIAIYMGISSKIMTFLRWPSWISITPDYLSDVIMLPLDSLCLKTYKSTLHSCFYHSWLQRYEQKYIFMILRRPSWISQFSR